MQPTTVRFPFTLRYQGRDVQVSAILGWLLLEESDYSFRIRLAGINGLEVRVLRPIWLLVLGILLIVATVMEYFNQYSSYFNINPLYTMLALATLGIVFILLFAFGAISVMRFWMESGQFIDLRGEPKKVAQLEDFVWEYITSLGRKTP